jgi:hypothetical protein
MSIRWLLAMALVAGAVGTGVAFSQSASEAQAKATTTEKVKTISARQWSRMKRQWSKQTVKWTSCNKQADDQKLIGRKSWTFIASCMNSA